MKSNTKQTYLNKIMMAITFAEAGEHETAKGMVEQTNKKRKRLETRVEQRPTTGFQRIKEYRLISQSNDVHTEEQIMSNDKTRLNKWDKLMMAITFAEAGEHETAKHIMEQSNKKEKRPETRVEQRPAMEL